ncbi:MAG: FmdB family transcriptional regulator [Herbaspirillum sp.]|nr:FmdB family transcriptional regulator [Herbaspirillum sp.]
MPIYAYRCEACGFAKDVLQKMSDDTLSVCPSCEQDAFRKQVTAAGFQLKGSGWYVTDFRNGSGGAAKTAPAANASDDGNGSGGKDSGSKEAGSQSGDSSAAAAPAAPATTGAAGGASAAPAAAASTKPAA